ncbi:hypothetical protein PROSTU_00797 [Providencia stuartii ATCC 25827]|uniref:Uncharacterized protein n=1 Tax=Providencia stuartii ATCC 25827 TaxID=471874 RepID=A0AA86Z2N6_PROST|nr:hypothetical protein PROSTU_00797 [Providencia stuartii ATCC 25827]
MTKIFGVGFSCGCQWLFCFEKTDKQICRNEPLNTCILQYS